MKYKNWEEFWGEFLQIRFHSENPELWPFRQKKALWFLKHCSLKPGAKILDLGCGDGLIDICLSRMGYNVVAVDRNKTVLNAARNSDDTKRVNFLVSDLREINFTAESFDAILFIETLGLMSKKDDANLISKACKWLTPKGKIILDCPEKVEDSNSWSKEFPEGVVTARSSFEPKSQIQEIQFYFRPNNEDEFGLLDPYDFSRSKRPGVFRYIYKSPEIEEILNTARFEAQRIDHYYPENYLGFKGVKLSPN